MSAEGDLILIGSFTLLEPEVSLTVKVTV